MPITPGFNDNALFSSINNFTQITYVVDNQLVYI